METHLQKLNRDPSPNCVSSSAETDWAGLLIEKWVHNYPQSLSSFSSEKPILCLYTNGEPNIRWRARGISNSVRFSPGTCFLMDAGYQVNDLTADAPEECIIVEIDPLIVSRLTVRDLFKTSCLVPHIHGRYRAIELLVGAMEEEIVNGCTSGPLFAESISLALISYIGNHFSAHENSLTSPRQELSSARIRLIQDYIMSNMDQSFSLENLAVLANLSAQHLCFSFKKSMGITPYQFVLRCRIERAKQLLHEKDVSIAETALAVGFSSQSHFSDRFRRLTGLTPGEYRRTLGI